MKGTVTLAGTIEKVDAARRIVSGYATVEQLDKQGDIVDFAASVQAFGRWPGNIREQHDASKAVGTALGWKAEPERKAIWIDAYISKSPDGEATWTKVQEGVLKGFSIRGDILGSTREVVKAEDGEQQARRITRYRLDEVSLVDNPACPEALVHLVKSMPVETADGQKGTILIPTRVIAEDFAAHGFEKADEDGDADDDAKQDADGAEGGGGGDDEPEDGASGDGGDDEPEDADDDGGDDDTAKSMQAMHDLATKAGAQCAHVQKAAAVTPTMLQKAVASALAAQMEPLTKVVDTLSRLEKAAEVLPSLDERLKRLESQPAPAANEPLVRMAPVAVEKALGAAGEAMRTNGSLNKADVAAIQAVYDRTPNGALKQQLGFALAMAELKGSR